LPGDVDLHDRADLLAGREGALVELAHRFRIVDGDRGCVLDDVPRLVALQVADEVPREVRQVGDEGRLSTELLPVALAEVPVARDVGVAHGEHRLALAHGDEAHRTGGAPGCSLGVGDAGTHFRETGPGRMVAHGRSYTPCSAERPMPIWSPTRDPSNRGCPA